MHGVARHGAARLGRDSLTYLKKGNAMDLQKAQLTGQSSVQDNKTLIETVTENFLSQFTWGDTVSHSWFFGHLGIRKPSKNTPFHEAKDAQLKYFALMEKVRDRLTVRHKMILRAREGVGYEVVLPEEQTEFGESEAYKKLRKALREGRKRLVHIYMEGLTDRQRQENMDAQVRLSRISGLTGAVIRESRRNPATDET